MSAMVRVRPWPSPRLAQSPTRMPPNKVRQTTVGTRTSEAGERRCIGR